MFIHFLLLALASATSGSAAAPLTAEQIVDRMVQADDQRLAAFAGYTGARHYHFENGSFGKRADVTVRVLCDPTGARTFDVVEESGSGFVRNKVIRRMIDAEREASEKGEHQQTRIIPGNYEFRLLGSGVVAGRPAYVLEITPRTNNKYLVRGRIWVDAEDFAIARVEGTPAKSISFWVRSVHIVQQYNRVGPLWLPVTNESQAKVRIFGSTELKIDYFDYVLNTQQARARAPANPQE